jgi:CheY-like chemotaxis protein
MSKKLRVVVVDDTLTARQLMAHILTQDGLMYLACKKWQKRESLKFSSL